MCACQNKISGMAKRKKTGNTKVNLNMEFFGGVALAGAAGGFITENLEKISFVKSNPEMSGTIIGGIKAAGGWYMATKMDGDFVQGAGIGLIADGASDLLGGFINGIGSLNHDTVGTQSRNRHNRSARILGKQGRQRNPQRAQVRVF
jgi:hypothetical protein